MILDLTMPHVDGVEALRRMRRADPRTFVIVASGYATCEVEARFRALAPDAFMRKPFGADELRRHLRTAGERTRPPPAA